jgi:hypothetical protein
MADRAERLALNESAFRIANDRAKQWEERHADDAPELYLCECADPACRQRIPLSRQEYESVRANSRHFLCAPGHDTPDVETVIETHEQYLVIEKDREVTDLVSETDPRRG